MEKNEAERNKTRTLLMDLFSTLEELDVYLTPGHEVCEAVTRSMNVPLTNNPLTLKTRELMERLMGEYLAEENYSDAFYRRLRHFVSTDCVLVVKLYNSFFNNLVRKEQDGIFYRSNWMDINPLTLFAASYFLLNLTFRSLRNIVNRYLDIGFKENAELVIRDDSDPVWDTAGMHYREFESDISRIREYAQEILDSTDLINKDDVLLSLQISEFIKNAIRHGNKNDLTKNVRVWYNINNDFIKLIIEDSGPGFRRLEEWNRFNRQRLQYIEKNDLKNLMKFSSFRADDAVENDGGNFLFSALEYWDSGVIFNTKRNRIYLMKYFY